MNKETIHIENLSIGYPGKGDVKVVADGICAGINSGELTCLLGANGVGEVHAASYVVCLPAKTWRKHIY